MKTNILADFQICISVPRVHFIIKNILFLFEDGEIMSKVHTYGHYNTTTRKM